MVFIDRKTMKVNKILIVGMTLIIFSIFYLFVSKESDEGFQATAANAATVITIKVLQNGTTVDTSSSQYSVTALPTDTVGSLKLKLQSLTKLLPTQQILNIVVGTAQTLLGDNTKPLSFYGLAAGSTPTIALTTCQFYPMTSKYDDYYTSTYDNFTQNELNTAVAKAAAAKALNPIYSAPDIFIPSFGGLTDIDPNNIPWDADNKYADPNAIVWGTYPPNASVSIFVKVYNQNVTPVYNANTSTSEYPFPMVSPPSFTPGELVAINVAEQAASLAGAAAVGMAIDRAYEAAVAEGPDRGDKKVKPVEKSSSIKVQGASSPTIKGNMKRFKWFKGNAYLRATGAKLAKVMARIVSSKLATSIAASAAAASASAVSVVGAWATPFFIFIGVACILLATLTPAILDNATDDIRLCPPGYKPLRQIIPDYASNILSWVPIIGDIISTFQPYACVWIDPENKGKLPPVGTAAVVIAEPIPDPSYYNDITLSAYYQNRCPITDTGSYDNPTPYCPPVPGQPYYPPTTKEGIVKPWVDFSDRTMTDKMAQFYYDYSIRTPNSNGDGTITYEYITKIYSVCASSEFSCDIMCAMSSATYDPLTGCSYDVQPLPTDTAGNNMHDRRFYFNVINPTVVKKNASGTMIGLGEFVVSGCTNQDGTAPDAYNGFALPKMYVVNVTGIPKAKSIGTDFIFNTGMGLAQNVSMGAGLAGTAASIGGVNLTMGNTPSKQREPNLYATDSTGKPVVDVSGNKIRFIQEEYYNILIGPDISGNIGTGVNINKCGKVGITTAQCASTPYLQNMINTYHANNPALHLKTLSLIEARAVNTPSNINFIGYPIVASVCYYEGTVADYNNLTNLESNTRTVTLAVKNAVNTTVYPQACVFLPTGFDANPSQYIPMKFVNLKPGVSLATMPTASSYDEIPMPKLPMSGKMIVPTPIPDGEPVTKAQVDILVAGFNAAPANANKKIMRVLRTWAPKVVAGRVDMEVEMLRTGTTASVIEKETVAIGMNITGSSPPYPYASDQSSTLNSGTFIQSNTPGAVGDLSGGVMTVSSFMQGIATSINSLLAQFNITAISNTVLSSSQAAKLTSDDVLEKVYVSQTLAAPCAGSSCSDPQILNAIIDKYNADNAAPPNKMFGITTQKMASVLKAGVSSPTSCDILFNNQIDSYNSIVNNPISTVNIARAMRFTLVNTPASSCTFGVKSYVDVSSSAIGIRSDSTLLANPYIQSTCQVDCRNSSLLSAIKTAIEGRNTNKAASSLKKVTTSYSPTANTCEYKITKDYTTYGTTTKTVTGVTSYVSASVNFGTACAQTLNTVSEIYPDILDIQTDTTTGLQVAYMNGRPITMPILFSYDTKVVSNRVNTTLSSF